jgi:SAM-dependent methyltransferase
MSPGTQTATSKGSPDADGRGAEALPEIYQSGLEELEAASRKEDLRAQGRPMSFILQRPFSRVAGHSWRAELPAGMFPDSDDVSDPNRSCLALREDGADLGPPHTAHQIIEQQGHGQFSHWAGEFRFAASDNSDPNTNGRTYEVRWDSELYFDRRVNYALATLKSWAAFLPGGLSAFKSRAVLEVGPGRDMGTILLFAALGATRVCGVDRFKGAWQDGWHDVFISKLRSAAPGLGVAIDDAVMTEALARKSLEVGPIEFFGEPFEEVGDRLANSFDVGVSHSTFEHFYSVEQAARALATCLRLGGIGVHSVDFRDHANFGQPLEFLLIGDPEYEDLAVNSNYGRGNRMRAPKMIEVLKQAGFAKVDCHRRDIADAAYLDAFIPRLRSSRGTFADMTASDLEVLSAVLVLLK